MKKILQIAVLALTMVFVAAAANAQEWSKEQTEVWNVVEQTWTGWSKGDASIVFPNIHEKYQGWSSDHPLPLGKKSMEKMFTLMKDAMKMADGNWSRAKTEIVDHAKRSESSTKSETL